MLSGLVPRSFEAAYPLNGCPPLLLYNHYDKPIRKMISESNYLHLLVSFICMLLGMSLHLEVA